MLLLYFIHDVDEFNYKETVYTWYPLLASSIQYEKKK